MDRDTWVAAFEVHTLVAQDCPVVVAGMGTVADRVAVVVVAMYPLVVAAMVVMMVAAVAVAIVDTVDLAQIDLVDRAAMD